MRRPIEQFALLGQDQPARMTMEQRDIERLLEGADLARYSRLRKAELFAGMREAAGFCCGVEDLQLIPVHRCH